MQFTLEVEREDDGRRLATEAPDRFSSDDLEQPQALRVEFGDLLAGVNAVTGAKDDE